ncbi:MAG: xanthine dehydrogenase FAD-binding subunit XdhB [Spirochaetes bacterium]|jgi:xanthine dehydrogenase FAD-binding subunit|nr:xanthine dehydrogenase FAD-binding subunit XdhB [Spirochaetota bacterium]
MYDFTKYYEAESLNEAKTILKDNPNAKIIAGGSDILVEIREKHIEGLMLVGIHKIQELKEISITGDGTISIGSMVTFNKLEKNALINKHVPMLGEAGGTVGGPQLRRIATVGGNIANGAVSADTASSLFDFNAKIVLESTKETRIVQIKDFYLAPGKTDIRQGEIISKILINKEDYEGFCGNYIKFSQRNALDIANLGCAVLCKLNGNKFAEVRIALGVAAPIPIRCKTAEDFAKGLDITEANIIEIGKKAVLDANPRDSWRASKAYRQQLIEVCSQRALTTAVNLAGGKIQ